MSEIEKKIEQYSTDGNVVRNQDGDCMGIFSTVSVLNDRELENYNLRDALDKFTFRCINSNFTFNELDMAKEIRARFKMKEVE